MQKLNKFRLVIILVLTLLFVLGGTIYAGEWVSLNNDYNSGQTPIIEVEEVERDVDYIIYNLTFELSGFNMKPGKSNDNDFYSDYDYSIREERDPENSGYFIPDVYVGRLPVKNDCEFSRMLNKIIMMEKTQEMLF